MSRFVECVQHVFGSDRCLDLIQPVPIPSYLLAIACGNVRYRPFPKIDGKDWTCGVWAEPELIDAAYWEFSEDTGR
jgi:leukotriene-A4 hydrolase